MLLAYGLPVARFAAGSPSSAHTYRLLIFKERCCLFRVALQAAEKRDYGERFEACQHLFRFFPKIFWFSVRRDIYLFENNGLRFSRNARIPSF
jgi:hypothetical protein